MVLVSMFGLVVIGMKDTLLMTKEQVKVSTRGYLEMCMMVTG